MQCLRKFAASTTSERKKYMYENCQSVAILLSATRNRLLNFYWCVTSGCFQRGNSNIIGYTYARRFNIWFSLKDITSLFRVTTRFFAINAPQQVYIKLYSDFSQLRTYFIPIKWVINGSHTGNLRKMSALYTLTRTGKGAVMYRNQSVIFYKKYIIYVHQLNT